MGRCRLGSEIGRWGTCLGRLGDALAEDFEFDITEIGVQCDGHGEGIASLFGGGVDVKATCIGLRCSFHFVEACPGGGSSAPQQQGCVRCHIKCGVSL